MTAVSNQPSAIKCNKSITFTSGDRVKIFKSSGTYIVEYAI